MNKFGLWAKRNSPELLLGAAITSAAASVVLACLETKKLPEKLEKNNKEIVKIHKNMDKLTKEEEKDNSAKLVEYKKNLKKVYVNSTLITLKTYAPSILTFGVSVASMLGSHKILKAREASVAAALALTKTAFDSYRDRVKKAVGEEAENAIYKGLKDEKVTIENKDGKKLDLDVEKIDLEEKESYYGAVWGVGNNNYDRANPSLNITGLLQDEQWFNQTLQSRGYLFLDEVYKRLGYTPSMLGEKKMQAAHVLGWIYDPEDKSRDSYVSFGLHDVNGELTPEAKRMQSGLEEMIWLEFNVDGDILTGNNGSKTFMKSAIKKG